MIEGRPTTCSSQMNASTFSTADDGGGPVCVVGTATRRKHARSSRVESAMMAVDEQRVSSVAALVHFAIPAPPVRPME